MSAHFYEFTNNLQRDLSLAAKHLDHGRWTTPPPARIAAGATVSFGAETDDDGAPRGKVSFKIQDLDADNLVQLDLRSRGVYYDPLPIWVRIEYTFTSTTSGGDSATGHNLTLESNQ